MVLRYWSTTFSEVHVTAGSTAPYVRFTPVISVPNPPRSLLIMLAICGRLQGGGWRVLRARIGKELVDLTFLLRVRTLTTTLCRQAVIAQCVS